MHKRKEKPFGAGVAERSNASGSGLDGLVPTGVRISSPASYFVIVLMLHPNIVHKLVSMVTR